MLMGVLVKHEETNLYTLGVLVRLERDIAAFGRSNLIEHIVVPMDEVTEVSCLRRLQSRRFS